MRMLEIRNASRRGGDFLCDGRRIGAGVDWHARDRFTVTIRLPSVSKLGSYTLGDIPSNIVSLVVRCRGEQWFEKYALNRFLYDIDEDFSGWYGAIRVGGNSLGWAESWSIRDYVKAARALAQRGRWTFAFRIEGGGGVHVLRQPLENTAATIQEVVEQLQVERREFDRAVRGLLADRANAHSVSAQFDFPADVKTACEQYLLHFVEFLRDLGVEATAELREAISGVMFSVTPRDHVEALDRIRLALNVYLRLPGATFVGMPADVAEQLAIQKLEMTVHFLKAQLAAAESKSLYLAAAATAQRYTIELLQAERDPRIISAEPTNRIDPDEQERILNGLVAITKYKGEGFEIDLPELYRRLRTLFARK